MTNAEGWRRGTRRGDFYQCSIHALLRVSIPYECVGGTTLGTVRAMPTHTLSSPEPLPPQDLRLGVTAVTQPPPQLPLLF
jgi:hypothetical protein